MKYVAKIQKEAGFNYELTFNNDNSLIEAQLNHLGVEHRLYLREEFLMMATKDRNGQIIPAQKSHSIVAAFKSEEDMNFVRLSVGGIIEAYVRI